MGWAQPWAPGLDGGWASFSSGGQRGVFRDFLSPNLASSHFPGLTEPSLTTVLAADKWAQCVPVHSHTRPSPPRWGVVAHVAHREQMYMTSRPLNVQQCLQIRSWKRTRRGREPGPGWGAWAAGRGHHLPEGCGCWSVDLAGVRGSPALGMVGTVSSAGPALDLGGRGETLPITAKRPPLWNKRTHCSPGPGAQVR